VPSEVGFLRKWEIALDLIDALLGDDVPCAPVIADSGYGDATAFRDALTSRGLKCALGVKGDTSVWPPGLEPLRPEHKHGGGRPATRLKRDEQHQSLSIKRLAASLPAGAWREVRWRGGSKGLLRSRFASVSVRPAHRNNERSEPRPFERLLIEWPEHSNEPTKYWLSTVSEQTEIGELVSLAKLRWRTLRDYQELKDELGLDHYEGRSWRGFHHHAVLCIAAYAFLAAERGRLSPPQAPERLRSVPLPAGFTPRGSPRPT